MYGRRESTVVEFVSPKHSPVSCPKCGQKTREVGYRWFKCTCGREDDHDVVAANLNRRGSPISSTTPRGCTPNRWREPFRARRKSGSFVVPYLGYS
ncbi:zinc ribbon domain-containing protein [Sulfodiicoccus acidiphilus]|uniref:zinc ribbon domain-containing protein n=1 Tax=Sulfodiicoccus acidiphilus TaxID=1670455 RepID=UPI003B8A99D3